MTRGYRVGSQLVTRQLAPLLLAVAALLALIGCASVETPATPGVSTREVTSNVQDAGTPAVTDMPQETAPPAPSPTRTLVAAVATGSPPATTPTPTASPRPSSTETTATPASTEPAQGGVLEIPFGMGVYEAENVTVFNRYARPEDVVAVRPPFMELLAGVEVGRKKLVFAPRDEPLTDVDATVSEARALGVTLLGYNLEQALPEDELVQKERDVQQIAAENGLLYVFGPTLVKLLRFHDEFARNADVILLQSQAFQTKDEYEARVEELIAQIRAANPNAQVWVQVSVNPPADRRITAAEVVHDIQLIADSADLIWIYYVPKTAATMEEVVRMLRQ